MNGTIMPYLGALLAACLLPIASAQELDGRNKQRSAVVLGVDLRDGSHLKSKPVSHELRVQSRLLGAVRLSWAGIKTVEFARGSDAVVLDMANGDRFTVAIAATDLEFDCALGRVKVPVESLQKIQVTIIGGNCRNVALGKPVSGAAGASHGKGLARHVTDGDLTTHAKPPASAFDYCIDLQDGGHASYTIEQIVIHWGRFGDRFIGVRKQGGEGWAPAAWPGEYVTQYTVECRKAGSEEWQMVHHHEGRPVDEIGEGVLVEKRPTAEPGCSSESSTLLRGLKLEGISEVRIRAKGGHWIGLFELEVMGFVDGAKRHELEPDC